MKTGEIIEKFAGETVNSLIPESNVIYFDSAFDSELSKRLISKNSLQAFCEIITSTTTNKFLWNQSK